jgi:hypothetical protein
VKLIIPGQNIKVDTPDGVDAIWYEKFAALFKNLSGMIDSGGPGGAYQEGNWLPVPTFTTPGNLVWTPSFVNGKYTRTGRLISASFALVGTVTHSTAAGNLIVNGLPFAPHSDTAYRAYAPVTFQGITKVNYTSFYGVVVGNTLPLQILASGSGQAIVNVTVADVPTGGTLILGGVLNYVTGAN